MADIESSGQGSFNSRDPVLRDVPCRRRHKEGFSIRCYRLSTSLRMIFLAANHESITSTIFDVVSSVLEGRRQ